MKTRCCALLQKFCLRFFAFLCLPLFSFAEDPAILKSDSLYRKADYRQAISVLEARLTLAQKNKENVIKIVLYNSLGKAYSQLGQSVEALKNYQLAIKMTEVTGDKQRTGKILKNIGALYE